MTEQDGAQSDAVVLKRLNSPNQPPCSQALGGKAENVDQSNAEITMSFEGNPQWTNPMGILQGGFLTAMLDEAMSVSAIVAGHFKSQVPTLELKVSFLAPARPGRLTAVARVIRNGKSTIFMEGELYNSDKVLLAKASATAMKRPVPGGKSDR